MSEYLLGVHSGHDASACLMKGNRLLFAITKERLTRIKHDYGDPIECIEYLLDAEKIRKSDIGLVVRSNWFAARVLHDKYYKGFKRVISSHQHHLFHAYSASLVAPPEPALILILDGRGCRPQDCGLQEDGKEQFFETESVYLHDGNRLTCLEKQFGIYEKNRYQWGSHIDSVGYAYAAVSKAIFGSSHAAGKVMALAAYGRENPAIPPPFDYSCGRITVRRAWLQFLQQQQLPLPWDSLLAQDMARSIQCGLEEYFRKRIDQLTLRYGISNLILGGGVALNCRNNGLIVNSGMVNSLGVYCACGDDGISVGAAIWGLREILDDHRPISWRTDLGRCYGERPKSNLKDCVDKVVDALVSDQFVSIFSGGAEFGPRALGHRSILASPLNIENRVRLNREIKKREPFRPFGGAVLERNVAKLTEWKLASPHMLSAAAVREDVRRELPGLIHEDGSIRLQLVPDETTLLGAILEEFESRTGAIALINTSFNGAGQPIVETPDEALRCAQEIGVRFLLLNDEVRRLT